MTDLAVMMRLAAHGEPLGIREATEGLVNSSPVATGVADRIEKRGHLVRSRCRMDRREVQLSLTQRGREVLAEIVGTAQGWGPGNGVGVVMRKGAAL